MQEYWITEYGAVADGVTNCAAAIQAAVTFHLYIQGLFLCQSYQH